MLKEVTAWMQSPLLRLDGSTVILLALAHAPKSGTTDPQFLGNILLLLPGFEGRVDILRSIPLSPGCFYNRVGGRLTGAEDLKHLYLL